MEKDGMKIFGLLLIAVLLPGVTGCATMGDVVKSKDQEQLKSILSMQSKHGRLQ